MRAIFLGTSGGIPTPRRSLPAVALMHEGEIMLFDCGEGAQTQFMRKGIGFGRLTKIFITHIHGDHLSGLMGLFMTLTMLEREAPLEVYGPPGLAEFFGSLERDIKLRARFPYSIHVAAPGMVVRCDGFHVEAAPVNHSVPCLAFAVQESVRPGKFDLDRARELGVPEGPLFGSLQKGETVSLPDGGTVSPSDVLGPPRKGRRVVYCTDTVYHPQIIPFCRDADLLIHESMFAEDMKDEARMRKHSTAAEAAGIARAAGVRRLALTHISARYLDTSDIQEQARAVFPETTVARDLMEIEIPYID